MLEVNIDGRWQRRTIVQSDDGYFYTKSCTGHRTCVNYPTLAALLQMYQDLYATRPACPRRRP